MDIIIKECEDDFVVCNQVRLLFDNVSRPVEEIWTKIEVRQSRLQDALLKSQKLQESFDDFLDRLGHLEERFDQEKPISAKEDVVKAQKKEHDQVHNDVIQLEPVFEQIMKEAEILLETAEPEEKDKLKDKIRATTDRYQQLKDNSNTRMKRLTDEVNFTQKLRDEITPFKTWLTETEKRLDELEPIPCTELSVSKEIKNLKAIFEDAKAKQPQLEDIEKRKDDVVENADVDQPAIVDDFCQTKERYDNLTARLTERELKLTELVQHTQEYSTHLKPIDQLLDKVEHSVVCILPLYGIDMEKISKEQDDVNKLVQELTDILPTLKDYNDVCRVIMDKADSDSPEQPIFKKDVDNLNERYKRLRDQLHNKHDQLNEYANKASKYHDLNNDFHEWMEKARKTPGVVEPIGTEPDVVKRQLKEVEVRISFLSY